MTDLAEHLHIGMLVEWKHAKGFGFIRIDSKAGRGRRVFVHARDLLKYGILNVGIGDVFDLRVDTDENGRRRAGDLECVFRKDDTERFPTGRPKVEQDA